LEERAGAAAMEIASRGTGIRHEQRVARENGVADDEAKMINGVTRSGERLDREVAEREMFAVGQEFVERVELDVVGLQAVDIRDCGGDFTDPITDRDCPAQKPFELGSPRDVVVMDVCVENPAEPQSSLSHEARNHLDWLTTGVPRRGIEVEYWIDDSAGFGSSAPHDMARRSTALVVKRLYVGFHRPSPASWGRGFRLNPWAAAPRADRA